jgi:polar amino acid transport system substrate-binding protein
MRRALLALGAVLALAGTAMAAPAPAPAPAPVPTAQPGVLTVGLNMPAQGFQVGAAQGTGVVLARGFEVDLAGALARRLGVPKVVLYQESSFPQLLAPGAKPWDVALAQVTITAGRRRAVDFSVPYMNADQGVLLRRGLSSTPTSIAGLRPLQLCVQRGTTSAAIVARRVKPTRPAVQEPDETRLAQDLQTGRCDAGVLDAPVLAALKAAVPRRYGPLAGVIPTGERYGVVLAEGSPLTPFVNRALSALIAQGAVARLSQRWLTTNLAQLPVLR